MDHGVAMNRPGETDQSMSRQSEDQGRVLPAERF